MNLVRHETKRGTAAAGNPCGDLYKSFSQFIPFGLRAFFPSLSGKAALCGATVFRLLQTQGNSPTTQSPSTAGRDREATESTPCSARADAHVCTPAGWQDMGGVRPFLIFNACSGQDTHTDPWPKEPLLVLKATTSLSYAHISRTDTLSHFCAN